MLGLMFFDAISGRVERKERKPRNLKNADMKNA
jgi:hypothetical protein